MPARPHRTTSTRPVVPARRPRRGDNDDGDTNRVDLGEYAAGHLPGAISVPPGDIDALLDELPADREIVAYCRGPYCAYADDAIRRLVAHGRRARRLREGIPEWRRLGGPLEASPRP